MPSCVMYDHTKVVVGKEAYKNREKECTVYSVKRHMQDPNAIVHVKDLNDKLEFKPEEISAEILKGLVEQTGGLYGKIEDVIVTVPAYFDQNGVNATKKACELAGLNLIGIANEPTAASLCYDLKPSDGGTKDVVVYDLGGGTFDATLMRIVDSSDKDDFDDLYDLDSDNSEGDAVEDSHSVITLGIDGDTHLGGDDIDEEMLRIVCEKLKAIGVDASLFKRDYLEGMKLRLEGFKKQDVDTSYIMCINCINKNGVEIDEEISISPMDFERATSVIFNKTKVILDRLLRSVDNNADTIVLTGGSTKNPIIVRMLMQEYPTMVIDDALSPDLSVSQGAAIQGKVKKFGDSNVKIFDILPLTIGVKDGYGKMVPIITKGSSLPTVKTVQFSPKHDNQEVFNIELFQGNSPYADECVSLGMLHVNIPEPDKAEKVLIEVSISISVDRLMMCTVKVEGITKELQLDLTGEVTQTEELSRDEKMLKRLLRSSRYMTVEDAVALNKLADEVRAGKKDIKELKLFVKEHRVNEINED